MATEGREAGMEERARAFWKTLPHCAGGEVCDGDLPGEPHEPECPVYGLTPDFEEPNKIEFAAMFAASEDDKTKKWVLDRMRRITMRYRVGGGLSRLSIRALADELEAEWGSRK